MKICDKLRYQCSVCNKTRLMYSHVNHLLMSLSAAKWSFGKRRNNVVFLFCIMLESNYFFSIVIMVIYRGLTRGVNGLMRILIRRRQ